jgi:hydroxymethylglutaryl-CoA synthase
MRDEVSRDTIVGLDHVTAYVPNQYLPMEELARARGVDPSKFLMGIGIREMAVPLQQEDVVVLGANAGRDVLEEAGVSPKDVGLLIVGTESAEDKSKPTATHIHELLGISSNCRVYDVIHACIGATYGVLTAIDWVRGSGNYALVIASDIAKYGINAPGEATQGAGAVAMLISRNPRLMALEEIGAYSKNVYDFWKPLDSDFPIVKGVYSAECYTEAVLECFSGRQIDKNAAFLYHTPYPGLVKQAHARVVKMLGEHVDPKQHYEDKVASSILYASRVGNIYTGSLWLSLVSFLENHLASATESKASTKGELGGCYLFSYGSGCGAVLMRGELSRTWAMMAQKLKVGERLEKRVKLSVEEYERLMYSRETVRWNQPTYSHFKFEGVRDNERVYARID